MKLKKCAALILTAAMTAAIAAGCGSNGGGADNGGGNEGGSGNESSSADDNTSKEPAGEIEVDFWTAPQQVQYDLWESKAQAFNETKTEVDGKVVKVKVQQMPESPSSEAGIRMRSRPRRLLRFLKM